MANLSMYAVNPINGCWEWTGANGSQGYGSVGVGNNKTALAHRASWESVNGPIPEGAQIDHLCHNSDPSCAGGVTCRHRLCINPDHLEPVSGSENTRRALRSRPVRAYCGNGHEMVEENVRVIEKPTGRVERACIECKRAAQRRAYRRRLERDGGVQRKRAPRAA